MLSKSQYTKYLQCPKAFWLYRNDKGKLTPASGRQQQMFDTGTTVGELARQLFPDGDTVEFDIANITGMTHRTRELIDTGAETIYEASFLFDDVFVAVDILRKEAGFWNIYEVKSSTSVKDVYIDDAAVQAWVVENSGLQLKTINVAHINTRYEREGELDIQQLFAVRNVSERAHLRMKDIPERITAMKQVQQDGEPDFPIGIHCLNPYECDAKDYCWRQLAEIPEKSVFTLTAARRDTKFELYKSGIIKLEDVPLEDCTPAQRIQVLGELHVEKEPIAEFLSSLEYPITHLDFESFQPAIPEYQGTRPYAQIPFQYSLHIENSPGLDGSEKPLKHKEYLATIGTDPRRDLAENLLSDIPASGTILVYNQVFEKQVIGRLAETFEDLREDLLNLNHRIRDLMLPFKERWYYHPDQNGRYSIKKVLPALVPKMEKAYSTLPGVSNGGEASAVWSVIQREMDQKKVAEIRQGLLAYCELDTLAMVKILEVMRYVPDS